MNAPVDPQSHEFRAAILGEVVRQSVITPGPINANALASSVLRSLGLPEELGSVEVMGSMSLLIRLGFLQCSRYYPETEAIIFGADTTIVPVSDVLRLIWAEKIFDRDDADCEDS